MPKYIIRDYQEGFEKDQVRIGIKVARKWIWPYAYNLEDLLKIHARPDFDPSTRHYCFLGEEMVGFMYSTVADSKDNNILTADLNFPRMLSGHEQAAELLIKRAFEILGKKKISRVLSRVTTMCPGDIKLAEKTGFSIKDWGFKTYFSYEMGWGDLSVSDESAEEISPEEDLDECAELASRWYKRPPEFCRSLLEQWHDAGIITHSGVRKNGKLIASCMAAPNDVRPSTAAIYYIYAPNEQSLKPMLAKVISKCINYGSHNVIADLINEHRQYDTVYRQLGFKKAAEWARCEKLLDSE